MSESGRSSTMRSSAVMAAGTVVSRLSGFVRNGLLIAAIGNGLHGDLFNIANTIPNMLYILLAGGVFNAVLVPQLVRAMKHDPDGGEAYTNRIITLAALFLAGASAVLVIAAPLLMHLFLDGSYFRDGCLPEREAVFAFARYCLPQVFFYGMFVLVGQVLNARGRFGPMMWAPIANNVVAVATLAIYLGIYGTSLGRGFTGGQEALLGLGSTLGIAVQLFVLVPYLRSAGFAFKPRFDFRNTGLGHTFRLGVWTVLFVIVNQIAYTVVVRIASSGTAHAVGNCGASSTEGTGYTIYSLSFLLVMVPHSIITVSLATAILPQLSRFAAEHDYRSMGRELSQTARTTYAVIIPLMAVLPIIAKDLASLVYGYGAASSTYDNFVPSLSLFALGICFYTTHYLMLRGFYALEQTKRVFYIQCVVAAVNILAAVLFSRGSTPAETAPRLVLAYSASYLIGAAISMAQLSRQLGGLDGRRTVRFGVRLVIAVLIATAGAWLVHLGLTHVLDGGNKILVIVRLALVGLVDLGLFLVVSRALRIREVTEVVQVFARRVGR